MMTTITPEKTEYLLRLHSNRKTWEPLRTSTVNSKPNQLVQSILAIRSFELCIKDSVEIAFATRLIPEELKDCYLQIIKDEVNHDIQLSELAKHYGISDVKIPEVFLDRFHRLCTTTNSLVLNYVIECMVFINVLPLLQRYGDSYANSVASWILLDEARHVAFGRAYTSALRLTVTTEVIRFAIDLLSWVLQDEPEEVQTSVKERAFLCLQKGVPQDTVQVIPQSMRFFEHDYIENYAA
jgi:hypothetical protein